MPRWEQCAERHPAPIFSWQIYEEFVRSQVGTEDPLAVSFCWDQSLLASGGSTGDKRLIEFCRKVDM